MYDERKPIQTKAAPTAGPAADDRFGAGPVATNASARIIKADVVNGRTRITIARGSEHGIHANMEGHVRVGGVVIADFQIDEVGPRVAYAFVDATIDQLGNARAHINPTTSSRKPATADVHTRVIANHVEDGRTRITIARGLEQGVTSGMSGHLVSASGQEGADFTIAYADATRSYAYVNNTPDHVAQHQQVVLRPMSRGGSPIQRRASGGASTVDVHSTAQAGVAGAASRLPHFDAIQRSFGKHDISGVQAQVGGAATDASAALGARAYATGNKVAFASSPDLHTAAHEAAHTIQQQRGAVGFQGLGAADDEHERHADAVADAVVAGQSAEPLLDQLGGACASGAIQRKELPRLDNEAIEARAIVAGFQAAQHSLDNNRNPLPAEAAKATRHLQHAAVAAKRYSGETNAEAVQRAADSFDQALMRFLGPGTRSNTEIDGLVELNRTLRDQLALSSMSSKVSYRREFGSETRSTLRSALELIAVRAQDGRVQLEGDPHSQNRSKVVAKIASDLDGSISYALDLLEQLPSEQRKEVTTELDDAAARISYILRWIRTRSGHSTMEKRFLETTHRFDAVLLSANMSSLVQREASPLSEWSVDTGKQEDTAVDGALKYQSGVLRQWQAYQDTAVDKFRDLAALQDIEEPNVVENVAMAIFVAALGHLGGELFGAAVARVGGKRVSAELVRRVVDVSTDAIQSIAGQALQTKTNKHDRARAFFVAGMKMDIADRIARCEQTVAGMVERSEITGPQINALSQVFQATLPIAHEAYFEQTVRAWTTYVAQTRLGTEKSHDRNKVTDMKDYFGEQRADGSRVNGTSRAHGHGVLSITMRMEKPGTKPKLEREATHVIGMNSEMAKAVVEAAGGRLDKVWLPKEVSVVTRFGRAVIALDEDNEVRDVKDWSEVVRTVGVTSGATFWWMWRREVAFI